MRFPAAAAATPAARTLGALALEPLGVLLGSGGRVGHDCIIHNQTWGWRVEGAVCWTCMTRAMYSKVCGTDILCHHRYQQRTPPPVCTISSTTTTPAPAQGNRGMHPPPMLHQAQLAANPLTAALSSSVVSSSSAMLPSSTCSRLWFNSPGEHRHVNQGWSR